MKALEPSAAAAVIGIAAFELWKAWGSNAPSLAECRSAAPDDLATRQQLLDANITVGGMAVVIGVSFAVLTRDMTALVLMLVMLGSLSFLHHWTLAAEPR